MFVGACSSDGGGETAGGTEGLTTVRLVTSNSGPAAGDVAVRLAMEEGWFEEEGIEVEILFSPGSGAAIQQLAAGNADVASTTPASVMQANLEGTPISMVLQHTYKQPFDIAAAADSGVTDVADLKGKTLGVSELSGGEMPMVRAALAVSGLSEGEDVRIVPAGEGDPSTVAALQNGTIDAYASSKRDIINLRPNGFEPEMVAITPDEVAAFPGDGMAIRTEFVESDPEVVDGFVRAALKGYVYTMANPEAAFAFTQANMPEALATDPELARTFFDLAIDNLGPELPASVANRGLFDRDSWETIMGFLQEGNDETRVLDGPVDLDVVLNESAVEKAWETADFAAIEEQAKAAG
ncbi:ABC transporter substrate-binding protein [Mycolicibacterium baixiangningiae]|uniref:ABC transporter substrate-binding protein n=1 Tax=Mycolicibacterium baixiangningiae TaxID=2761578 RepID=UPI0018D06567|nr:ABC transporter substrate-binding protein [Mycolicibacterium baixiangningiae]